jgi:hypothetical protein
MWSTLIAFPGPSVRPMPLIHVAIGRALFLTEFVDIQDPSKPKLISTSPTPVSPKNKGGRLGLRNTNILPHNRDTEKQRDLIYLTYFSAGLRIYDIKDERLPKGDGMVYPPPLPHRAECQLRRIG